MKNNDVAHQLRIKLKEFDYSTIKMNEEQFDKFIRTLTKEELASLLASHRSNRDFYKGISQEEYRKKNPKSPRYAEADRNVVILNNQGKKIKEVYDLITNQ